MVSSIQISETTKTELKSLKKKSSESYEDVIVRLIERTRKNDTELLKEGYLKMNHETLTEDWNNIDEGWD